jgi:hypothetical protein
MTLRRFTNQSATLLGVLFATVFALSAAHAQTTFYCSSDGALYALGKGGISCPTPKNVVPICPDGLPCVCEDSDGSCFDGDDD